MPIVVACWLDSRAKQARLPHCGGWAGAYFWGSGSGPEFRPEFGTEFGPEFGPETGNFGDSFTFSSPPEGHGLGCKFGTLWVRSWDGFWVGFSGRVWLAEPAAEPLGAFRHGSPERSADCEARWLKAGSPLVRRLPRHPAWLQ